ncbi:hypothetical protein QAD02_000368 [Eretmocerus hayati]|uniref:Uncharacterized protein n=1 Tax=Eretmocerus hayati TaxID=131215 RepID=A0ACC2NFJ6_9HYME|nr:hypothetical protein QAD02_000368 [Eretmocerus hayati]
MSESSFFLKPGQGIYDDFSTAEPIVGTSVPATGQEVFTIAYIKVSCETCEHHFDSGPGYDYCIGTIITNKHIITSASCINDKPVGRIQVCGRLVSGKCGSIYDVSSSVTFEEWVNQYGSARPDITNDIAIITLSKNIDKSYMERARLSFKKNEDLYEKNAAIVGWKNGRSLHKADVKIISPGECKIRRGEMSEFEIGKLSKETLCTWTRPHSLLDCDDDGSPLLSSNGAVIGVSLGNCLHDIPDIFHGAKVNIHANIYFYRKFIKAVTAGEKLLEEN